MRKRRKKTGFLFVLVFFAAICIGQPVLAAKVKAPTGLKADYDKNYIKLTWKKVPKARGYVVFVLKYRVSPERYPAPQEDLALAVRYVREHAQEYGADPENVLLMGFSAGGHLCASLGCLYREIAQMLEQETGEKVFPDSLRPDKLCLAYPVITFGEECHEGSFAALTGGDERLRKPLSLEHRVTVDFPETFLWACEDDGCVPPSNTMRMAAALKNVGAGHEMRLYPSGGHGCNLAFGSSAYAWTQQLLEFFQQLPQSIG